MGGTDDSRIAGHLGRGAQRAHAALLNGAQQLALHQQGQVADLVQEQRAALRGLEEAGPVVVGAGEGTLAVTEELGLQQGLRNGATVHRYEGAGSARRGLVDGTCHQFLARAGLPGHQDRRHAARDLFHHGPHLAHGSRASHQARQFGTCGRAGGRRRRGNGSQRCRGLYRMGHTPQGRRHHSTELPQVHRLGEVVEGTSLQRGHRVLSRTEGGDDDRALGSARTLQVVQQFNTQAIGQPHIGDQQVERSPLQRRQGLLHRTSALDVVPFAHQRQFVQGAQVGLIVDHQHTAHSRAHAASSPPSGAAQGRWRRISKAVPWSASGASCSRRMDAPCRSHNSLQMYRPSPDPRLRVEKKGSNM